MAPTKSPTKSEISWVFKGDAELFPKVRMIWLGLAHRPTLRATYLALALAPGLIERIVSGTP